jgi:hypothetical protein
LRCSNKGDTYFEQLAQWRPPQMPRPKVVDSRRERTWSEREIKVILGELFAPKRDDEQTQAAIARYRVGRKVQFSLLNGLRHSEMNLIPKTGIDWEVAKCDSDRARLATTKSLARSRQPQ